MITKWTSKDITKIDLGLKTTYISQAVNKETGMSEGIFFSNKPLVDFDDVGDNPVFIDIHNFQGAMSYMKAIIDLLETWKIKGMEDQIIDLKKCIETIIGV